MTEVSKKNIAKKAWIKKMSLHFNIPLSNLNKNIIKLAIWNFNSAKATINKFFFIFVRDFRAVHFYGGDNNLNYYKLSLRLLKIVTSFRLICIEKGNF